MWESLTMLRRPSPGEQRDLRLQVLRLGSMVEESLCLARAVLAGPNLELAPQVRLEDNRIDRLYKDLEERCLFLLSHRRSTQQETRRLIVYLQAIRDLERIGDYCKDLSTTGERLLPYQPLVVRDDLLTMLDRSRSLLAMALEALSCHDASAGQRLIALDDLVDQDYANIYEQLTKGHQLQSMSREAVVLTALASRSLERLADHAVNVSRRISRGATGAGQS
ncbi:phosphate signaling complex PhoU family protein [Candidatus Synechococcus spongiarum]|uniref:phosphate signaling complex PhoU family protein n=1 Tax=Candidatus Synechococcus spongiarum TaxID=431041 RepID=UPI000471BB59|nr:PhoU domain-containing protein [Candidatus Synechococcus spongiarum]